MDRTANPPPPKSWLEAGMNFLSLFNPGFLLRNKTAATDIPPSDDEQPASCVQMFSQCKDVTIGHGATFNNVAGNHIVNNINCANAAEAQGIARALGLRTLPQVVGFSDQNALIITDALGERFTLPFSIVRTYEDMHDALVKYFRGKVGEKRVIAERYCLAHLDGTLVRAQDWNNVEQMGELIMSMVMERLWSEALAGTCPKCGPTELGIREDDGWLVCRSCNTRFTPPYIEEDIKAQPKERDQEILYFRNLRAREIKTEALDDDQLGIRLEVEAIEREQDAQRFQRFLEKLQRDREREEEQEREEERQAAVERGTTSNLPLHINKLPSTSRLEEISD